MYKQPIIIYYGFILLNVITIQNCVSVNNIYVKSPSTLASAEGPYNPDDELIYTIKIEVHNLDTKKLSLVLEHPFWEMIPEIKPASNAIIMDATKQINESNIYISISCLGYSMTENDFIAIVFKGTKRQFFDAIQFFYGYPPLPPIRYSPPVYPIRIKSIQYELSNQQTMEEPDLVSSFLITDFGLRLIIHIDLQTIPCTEDPIVELVTVNDIPMPYNSVKTKIDSDGNGVLRLPFTNIANFYSFYEDTFGVFELACNGTIVARSPSLYIGSPVWSDVDLEVPLLPITTISNWKLLD